MTNDADSLIIPPEGNQGQPQQNSDAGENKTATKPPETIAAPKGHVSKEDWIALGRREEDWQSPEEFQERGTELRKTVKKLEAELAATKERSERSEKAAFRALQRMREEQIADLRKRQVEASSLADTNEMMKLRIEEDKLVQSFADEDRQQPAAKRIWPETSAWIAENPWFEDDLERRETALEHYNRAVELSPLHPDPIEDRKREKQRLAYVSKKMSGSTAALPAPGHMPDVQGGTRKATPSKKGVQELDAETLKVAKRFVAKGLFKSIDEYAADYFAEG